MSKIKDTWKLLYLVTQVKDKLQCLNFLHIISNLKEHNIKRHYEKTHNEYAVFTGKLREDKFSQLDRQGSKQFN